jgi:hypothetical protein
MSARSSISSGREFSGLGSRFSHQLRARLVQGIVRIRMFVFDAILGPRSSKNVWFEAHAGRFGSDAKDKVEKMLWQKARADHTMSIDEARQELQKWTKFIPRP